MERKLKLAIARGATCSGCDIAVLDTHEKILEILKVAEIVFAPTIMDAKYKDLEAMKDGEIDVTLYHGAVRTSENENEAKLLREKSKLLVALGSCACFGGIIGLANVADKAQIFQIVYRDTPSTINPEFVVPQERTVSNGHELSLPEFYNEVFALDDKVSVDCSLPGCPPTPDLIMKGVNAIVSGEPLPKGATIALDKTVCDECKRKKPETLSINQIVRPHEIKADPERCFLEQGLICLGPATRGGCGIQCLNANMPCRGCMGPTAAVVDQGGNMLVTIASLLGLSQETRLLEAGVIRLLKEIKDPLGTFYRYTMPKSLLRRSRLGAESK